MTHKREHYETVYRTICWESNVIPQKTTSKSNYALLMLINDELKNGDCQQYSKIEMIEISEEME